MMDNSTIFCFLMSRFDISLCLPSSSKLPAKFSGDKNFIAYRICALPHTDSGGNLSSSDLVIISKLFSSCSAESLQERFAVFDTRLISLLSAAVIYPKSKRLLAILE